MPAAVKVVTVQPTDVFLSGTHVEHAQLSCLVRRLGKSKCKGSSASPPQVSQCESFEGNYNCWSHAFRNSGQAVLQDLFERTCASAGAQCARIGRSPIINNCDSRPLPQPHFVTLSSASTRDSILRFARGPTSTASGSKLSADCPVYTSKVDSIEWAKTRRSQGGGHRY